MKSTIANLLRNWKTTSAGVLSIAGSVVHLIFSRPLDETKVMAGITGILLGIGLLAAGDGNATPPPPLGNPVTA